MDQNHGSLKQIWKEGQVVPNDMGEKKKSMERHLSKMEENSSSFNPLNASSPESIIRAVGDLLAKMSKTSGEQSTFRWLRTFSGVIPTPAGEDSLETWLKQAKLMVEECEHPDGEKKLRLVDCLSGPALEII